MPQQSPDEALATLGLALSGLFELMDIDFIMTMPASYIRRARLLTVAAPIRPVLPFLATAMVTLITATLVNSAR